MSDGDMSPFDLERALYELRLSNYMLQWKTELQEFCQFMIHQRIRSFLEIGVATGQLCVFLKDTLCLERVYACDINRSPLLTRRPHIPFYHGDHHGAGYGAWRERIGPIDMVFIDADHKKGFRKDYEIERRFPHRFIAFHDIANPGYPQLCAFWEHDVQGRKRTFVNQDPHIKFGVPPLRYPFGPWKSVEEYEGRYGRCCGIGVCWSEERPT